MAAMQCLTCEHPNSASAKFCEQCGSALNLRLCPKCEAVNDSKAARCHGCDAPLAPARAVRKRPLPVALATAALAGAVIAGGALYLLARPGLEAAPARVTPVAPAPAPAERSEPVPAVLEAPAKAKPAARIVTHTRTTAASRAPEPEVMVRRPPIAAETAPQPIAAENAPPRITHTRRAVVAPDTKTGSN